MKNAIVVDDERLARRRIRRLLEQNGQVRVTDECRNGWEAVAAMQANSVDVVFLDVQMPGLDGFGVIDKVGADAMPTVVFVTAYEDYAVRAFEANAIDYLVKPIDEARLQKTIARLDRPFDDLNRRLSALLRHRLGRSGAEGERLLVREGKRFITIRTEDVDFIRSEGNYVRITADGRSFLVRDTMARLDATRDPERFARIHRSTIVRVDRVQELLPAAGGDMAIKLRNGQRLAVSRRYRGRLGRLLGWPSSLS